MALIFYEMSTCLICDGLLHETDDIVGFPPFVLNEVDPIHIFSDSAAHYLCLQGDKLGVQALNELKEWTNRNGPGKRECSVCGMAQEGLRGQPVFEGWN